VRRRILATVLACTALATTVLFLPAANAARGRERRSHALELQRDAMVVASRIPDGPVAPDVDLPRDGRDRYALYGVDGRRISGDGPEEADAPVRRALQDQAADVDDGEDLVTAVPLAAVDGHPQLVLRAEEPTTASDARVRATITELGLAAVAALVVAAVAGWLLVRRLVRPLDDLGEVAARIGDGDFTVTAAPTGLAELDRLGHALEASAQRVGRLVERERAFSADASHQLRTPLAALRTTLEAELYAPRDEPGLAVREGLEAVERLEATVTQLLDLARDQPLDRALVDIGELLRRHGARWEAVAASLGRQVVVIVEDAPRARASGSALTHVVDVLVDNALRHGTGRVTVRASRERGGATVTVGDEGTLDVVGDPERLFLRRESDRGSTGIGLHLARRLAEAEGGRLRLSSRAPTTFTLTLRPLAGIAEAAADAGHAPPPDAGHAPPSVAPQRPERCGGHDHRSDRGPGR
jgi:signal transduction histidine kinase